MGQASLIADLSGLYRVAAVHTAVIPPPYTPLTEPGCTYTCVVQRFTPSPEGYEYKWLTVYYSDRVVDDDANHPALVENMSKLIDSFFKASPGG